MGRIEQQKTSLALLLVLFGINEPPKFLGKVARIVTHAFQIVQILRRDLFKGFAHTTHGDKWQSITPATPIEFSAKIFHEFPPLRAPGLIRRSLEVCRNVLHSGIVHFPL